jgi:hypothetical protein
LDQATSEIKSEQSQPELDRANAQRHELQTKQQATPEIKSAQFPLELEKANAQSNMVDPVIAGWQSDFTSYVKVGDALMAQGARVEALKWYRDSLAVADHLANADAQNPGWQRDRAIGQGRIAIVLAEQGETSSALDMLRQGRAIISGLTKQSTDNRQLSNDLAAFDESIAKLGQANVSETGSVKSVQVAP